MPEKGYSPLILYRRRLSVTLPQIIDLYPYIFLKHRTRIRPQKTPCESLDVPLNRQSDTGRLRIVIFPDKTEQTVLELPQEVPSEPLQMACRANAGRAVIDQETQGEILKRQLISFDPADSTLKKDERETLRHFVDTLPKSSRLTITGFTDNQRWHQDTLILNATLAQERAEIVRDYLTHLGVDEKVMTVGASPLCCYVATNATQAGRSKNRRAEIVVQTETGC